MLDTFFKIPFTVQHIDDGLEERRLERCDLWEEEAFYGMFSNREIPRGTVVLVENAIIGNVESLTETLKYHSAITDRLYPRSPSEADRIKQKIDYNVFEWEADTSLLALCPQLSFCNHSCQPNLDFVTVNKIADNSDVDFLIQAFVVYTLRDINPNDELTISYGPDVGHPGSGWDWKCNCGISEVNRVQMYVQNRKIVREWFKEDEEKILEWYSSD